MQAKLDLHEFATQIGTAIGDRIVSEVGAKFDELKTALAGAVDRITADFDALKAKVERGVPSVEELASLQQSIDALKAIDPDPANPAVEPPTE